jgi:hypothetical protein
LQEEKKSWWEYESTASKEVKELTPSTRAEIEEVTGAVPLLMKRAIEALPNWRNGLRSTYLQALKFGKDMDEQYSKKRRILTKK